MKKRIALLLSFVLVLSLALCACGGGEKKETLVGTWNATIDIAEVYNAEIAASGDEAMAEYLSVDSFAIPLVMTFNEDGTYSLTVDKEGMDAAMNGLIEDMKVGLEKYFNDYFSSMGLEIDVVEALAASGMSLDALVEEMKAEIMTEDMYADMESAGQYKAEDGKLYLTEDVEVEPVGGVYNTYTIEGDTLTIEAGTEELEDEMAELLFPLVLKRAK